MFLIPNICPICGEYTEIIKSDSGVRNLFCSNPQCQGKIINRIDHLCSKKALDIKGISKATLEKLVEWEWITDLKDVFLLKNHRNDWIKKEGFGIKSVDNILSSIENAKNTELWRVLSGGGIPEIGIVAAKQLAEYFKTYDNFKSAINSFNFLLLPNFGSIMSDYLKSFDYSELDDLVKYLSIKEENQIQTSNCKDLIFVITGALKRGNRDTLKSLIATAGGKTTDSISTKTSYLITNDTKETAKYKKAKQLGIPIINEQEFYKKFDL